MVASSDGLHGQVIQDLQVGDHTHAATARQCRSCRRCGHDPPRAGDRPTHARTSAIHPAREPALHAARGRDRRSRYAARRSATGNEHRPWRDRESPAIPTPAAERTCWTSQSMWSSSTNREIRSSVDSRKPCTVFVWADHAVDQAVLESLKVVRLEVLRTALLRVLPRQVHAPEIVVGQRQPRANTASTQS